ncbi:MAG: peptidoglycan bridge formation glycyltransferase FemA/FemB family protein [Candidatus Thorarchaeota archaeon]|nr:peptidoglycan bridge formation glycyltransferase FemA/FemB family protein [Candidatus Thorarchaeota archaeon]
MSIHFRYIEQPDDWNATIDEFNISKGFSLDYDWLESKSFQNISKTVRVIALNKNNEPIAAIQGLLVNLERPPFLSRRMLVLGGLEGGSIVAPEISGDSNALLALVKEVLRSLDSVRRKIKTVLSFEIWTIHIHPMNDYLSNILRKLRFEPIQRKTPILSLIPSRNELWENLSKKTRNVIRQADSRGVTIADQTSEKGLERYVTMKNKEYGTVSDKDIAMYRKLLSKKLLWVLEARLKDEVLASGLFSTANSETGYLGSAMNKNFQWYRPMDAIMWEAIQKAKEDGSISFNMFGADSSNSKLYGITKFKMGFGCTYQEYTSFIKIRANLLGRNISRNRWELYLLRLIQQNPLLRKLSPV